MAGWRAQGYVADSDEEEDSQPASFTDSSTPHKVSLIVDDAKSVDVQKNYGTEHDKGKRADLPVLAHEVERSGKCAGQVSGEFKEIQGFKAERQRDKHHDITSLAVIINGNEHGNLDEYYDIDELQQDHCDSTPSAQLQAESFHGARDQRNLQQPIWYSRSRDQIFRSMSSSPLSSAPTGSHRSPSITSARSSNSRRHPSLENGEHNDTVLETQITGSGIQERPATDFLTTETGHTSRRVRSLRHRNPIQLHPYQIESEKYRQILKARGVKPLRIAQMEADISNASEQESQRNNYNTEDSQLNNEGDNLDDAASSSPLGTQGWLKDTSDYPTSNSNNVDDDLPDFHALLCNSKHTFVGHQNKRRKISFPSFRMPRGFRSGERFNERATTALEKDGHVFDVPPSPPQSGSQTPSTAVRLARSEPHRRRTSSPALPTPVTSSEPRRQALLEMAEDEEIENVGGLSSLTGREGVTGEESHLPSISGHGSSEPTSEDESSSEIQRAKHKIRGVLPASWLKLDLRSRNNKVIGHQGPQPSSSPEKSDLQRGVARIVTARGNTKTNLHKSKYQALEVSEEEGSSSEMEQPRAIVHAQSNPSSPVRGIDTLITSRLGEATEDDHVDAMLPSATRQRVRPRKVRKRQAILANLREERCTASGSLTEGSRIYHSHRPRIIDEFDKIYRRRSAVHTQRLSVLDAPAMRQSSETAVPRFLRIASRTARARKDKGKHSPFHKYLRLATEIDDKDTRETLRDWREGTMAASPTGGTVENVGRQPLYPRSVNSMSLPTAANVTKVIKQSILPFSKSNATRIHSGSNRLRTIQKSLDHHLQNPQSDRTRLNDPSEAGRLRRGNHKSKHRGQIVSTLQDNNDTRAAMLESQRQAVDEVSAETLFERDLTRINHVNRGSGLLNVLRLFGEDMRKSPNRMYAQPDHASERNAIFEVSAPIVKPVQHRRNTKRPERADVSTSWSRQPDATHTVYELSDEIPVTRDSALRSKNVLLGLASFGAGYSDTFGIVPLPTGTCFHEQTVLGSGTLAVSLQFPGPSLLSHVRGHHVWTHELRTFRWGPWNDEVSSELGEVLGLITHNSENILAHDDHELAIKRSGQVTSMLKAVVTYLCHHLSFVDDIDRISYIRRCEVLISAFLNDVLRPRPDQSNSVNPEFFNWRSQFRLRLGTLSLVILNSAYQITRDDFVPTELRERMRSLLQNTAQQNLRIVLTGDFKPFKVCLSHFSKPITANYIIGEEHSSIEALVVAHHVLRQSQELRTTSLEVLQKEINAISPGDTFDIQILEQYWIRLFSVLPFFDFDTKGILETGRRFKVENDNWNLVKGMISPVLEASLKNPRGQGPSFNAYCRALFGRCLHLINGWGWRRCELIIGTLFDFFARNNLAHLRNEQSHDSPLFLGQLDKNPPLTAQLEDRSFHILLKIIGSGIRGMGRVYPEKKIRDVVWRLMPNHGRFHPKEDSIRQEDLDALRNHHDLLCTLYWASPASCRPRLTAIRNLVNLEASHRQACHINIRAWFNLVTFQLSTDEPIESLAPFAEWHHDVLTQVYRQHALARTEAEGQVQLAQQDEGLIVSKEILESTITRNQKQAEAVLSDALIRLKLAVGAARNERAATVLMSTSITRVFELFDPRRLQVCKVIAQSLDVLSAYISKSAACITNVHDENDDSQDYGDWPVLLEDDRPELSSDDPEKLLLTEFQEPLRQLLSNCFGSDATPDDTLLLKLVDTWVTFARVLVRKKKKTWNDYVDRFGSDSWSSLRDTEQTRKYTIYYLATLIEQDNIILHNHSSFFLESWIGSLVERESLLKFQHRFTETLLNTDRGSPIIQNLPFWTDVNTGLYSITAAEFAERRLSVISSVLSNMRVALEQAVLDPTTNATQMRQGYKDLLKHLMATMKHNYQELGHGLHVRGAYVDFVHSVVEFLQQHISTIYPIDRFFTDNGAFPLPATDPTYVVGQLRNYALRLQDLRTPKQLAIFLQSVSERAAIDGQQQYLVSQLHTAMSNCFEDSINAKPTLRSFVIKAVVPAYVSLAFTHQSGWILALPFLHASRTIFSELLLDLDGTNTDSVASVSSIVTEFLHSVRKSMETLIHPSPVLTEARILKAVSACYAAITTLLPVVDYLTRLRGPTARASNDIEFFKSFAEYMSTLLHGHHSLPAPDIDDTEGTDYTDIRKFASHELKDTLSKHWTCNNGHYYVIRGSTRREVVIDIGLYEEEKRDTFEAFEGFFDSLRAMPALADADEKEQNMTLQITIMAGMDALVV